MSIVRREFLRAAAGAGLAVYAPWRLPDIGRRGGSREKSIFDPATVRAMALRAIEAAMSAGASYADVRVNRSEMRWITLGIYEGDDCSFGVRALVDGQWGLVASTLWTLDEAARVGRAAAVQAKLVRGKGSNEVVLAPTPVVRDGVWTMPIEADPFEAPAEELLDEVAGVLNVFAWSRPDPVNIKMSLVFQRFDKVFASSDGSYIQQRLYQTEAPLEITFANVGVISSRFSVAGRGLEYVRGHLQDEVTACMAAATRIAALPVKPVDIGRYDVVFDGASTARLLDATLGAATELDRAMGYEANATGTSYLAPPRDLLGKARVAAERVTVLANRDLPGGAATVRWDDEGVSPESFALVKDGVLTDYQTTRESAMWLAAAGTPRSRGCAAAAMARATPVVATPNLRLVPAEHGDTLDGLIQGVSRGVLVTDGTVSADPNCLTGFGQGANVFEIRGGKVTARLAGAGFLFNANELWTSVRAVGGRDSLRPYGVERDKGEPRQQFTRTIEAPPIVSTNVPVIAANRRA